MLTKNENAQHKECQEINPTIMVILKHKSKAPLQWSRRCKRKYSEEDVIHIEENHKEDKVDEKEAPLVFI